MGNAPFKEKTSKVCQMTNIYPQYFQVVATAASKVNSYADIKGKRLVAQSKGNTAEAITATVLKLNGFDYSGLSRMNFQASYTDAVSMMKDGHVDVFTLGTTAPASAVMDLASARDIKLVPVDDKTMDGMRKMNQGYSKLIIKAGTYPKQDKDVPVIGYQTHLIVSCDMPEQVVYNMVKTMAQNIPAMSAVNKAIGELTPKMMAADAGIPMHPGAIKYFKEVGAL
jgi:TRAP transporter TAXI family solute receptor